MDEFDDRVKLNIFKGQTTYQNDYKKFSFENKDNPFYKPKKLPDPSKLKKTKQQCYQDNETFVPWRPNVHVPFDLFWRPKEIIRTDPYKPFYKPTVPENKVDENVIKTRPRIYMSPAISIDDVEDPEMRQLLCSHMYTTETAKAIQESEVRSAQREIPNTTVESCGDPVRLKLDLMPPLPQNFRKGKEWENLQMKYSVDPTRTFWEHKDPPVKCGACHDPVAGLVPNETKETIRDLIHHDKLRLAHDYPIPGYTGYRPRMSFGVSLAKKE